MIRLVRDEVNCCWRIVKPGTEPGGDDSYLLLTLSDEEMESVAKQYWDELARG